jgi:hypothetical protein
MRSKRVLKNCGIAPSLLLGNNDQPFAFLLRILSEPIVPEVMNLLKFCSAQVFFKNRFTHRVIGHTKESMLKGILSFLDVQNIKDDDMRIRIFQEKIKGLIS